MTKPTHITQRNGRSRGALLDEFRPYSEQIRFVLLQMNGSSFWAYSLWRAPEGADLLESIPFSEEYMQCAGTADALALDCLLYTSPSPRDVEESRMPSSA